MPEKGADRRIVGLQQYMTVYFCVLPVSEPLDFHLFRIIHVSALYKKRIYRCTVPLF